MVFFGLVPFFLVSILLVFLDVSWIFFRMENFPPKKDFGVAWCREGRLRGGHGGTSGPLKWMTTNGLQKHVVFPLGNEWKLQLFLGGFV